MSTEQRVRYWRDRALCAENVAKLRTDDYEHLLSWFNERISHERQLGDRCTYLYALATVLGASQAQLAGPLEEVKAS